MTVQTTTPVSRTKLSDYVEALQREVSLPGQFATDYPNVGDDDLQAALADAFAESQLDGWFGTYTLTPRTAVVTPALSPAACQLIVLYAGMRWVRIELRTLTTVSRYKAGPVEYEVQRGASVLAALLKDLSARKDALIDKAATGSRQTYVLDSTYGRQVVQELGRFAPLELPGGLMGTVDVFRGGVW